MKKQSKLTCKTGLKKNIIKKEVFDREIALCKMLSKENKGKCGWGKCKDCGVIPFLYKLHKGKLLEDPVKLRKIKDRMFTKEGKRIARERHKFMVNFFEHLNKEVDGKL